jgi:hypothetical protein
MKRKLPDMARALETYLDRSIAQKYTTPEAKREFDQLSAKEKLKLRKDLESASLNHYIAECKK